MDLSAPARLQVETIDAGLDIVRNSDSKLMLITCLDPLQCRTAAQAMALAAGWRTVDLNVQLARALVPLTAAERRERAWDALEAVIGHRDGPLVLTSTDILFEPTLGYRPYEALRRLGRRGPMLASWVGRVDSGDVVRSDPGHPEYVRARLDVPYISIRTGKGVGA